MASPSGKGSGASGNSVLWTSSCSPLAISKRLPADKEDKEVDAELLNLLGDENELLLRPPTSLPFAAATATSGTSPPPPSAESMTTSGDTTTSNGGGVEESKNSSGDGREKTSAASISAAAAAAAAAPAPPTLTSSSTSSSSPSSSSSAAPASLRAWGPSFGMKEPSGFASLLLTSTSNRASSFSPSVVPSAPPTSASATPAGLAAAVAAAAAAAAAAAGQSSSSPWSSLRGSPTFGDGRHEQRLKRPAAEELEDATSELTKRLRLESGASARLRQDMLDLLKGPAAPAGGSNDAPTTSSG